MAVRTLHRARLAGAPSAFVLSALLGAASGGGALGQETRAADWSLRIADRETGAPLAGVPVSFPEYGVDRTTDETGLVTGPNVTGMVRLLASPPGYVLLDTIVMASDAGGTLELTLARSPVELSGLAVEAERAETGSRQLSRLIFDREVLVGAVGVARSDIVVVPAVAEADVFRSLQSFAGVTSTHDLGAEIYVRGGNADQVGVRLDGAPVFAPHHMFGLFGAFNSDVIESVESYKGSLPARHGGSLSGMISARQRAGKRVAARMSGGVSLLGVRATAEGSLPWVDGSWLVAGRRASVDVAKLSAPYSFHDLNVGLQLSPAEDHRIRLSAFSSDDRLRWGYETSLHSEWANLASSLSWSWIRDNGVTVDATAFHSGYRAETAVGARALAPVTDNRIALTGVRGRRVHTLRVLDAEPGRAPLHRLVSQRLLRQFRVRPLARGDRHGRCHYRCAGSCNRQGPQGPDDVGCRGLRRAPARVSHHRP